MSQVTDFATKAEADLATINTALDTIVTLIANLRTQIGTLSPADQAALATVSTAADALVTKVQGIS